MKWELLCSLALVVLLGGKAAAADYFLPGLNLKWGESKAQVLMTLEKSGTTYTDAGDRVWFKPNRQLAMPVTALHQFTNNDELGLTVYNFKPTHWDASFYVADFNFLKDELIKQLGPPDGEGVVYYSDDFKPAPDADLGMAITLGGAVMYARWLMPQTEISLQTIPGGDTGTRITLLRKSRQLFPIIQEEDNQREQEAAAAHLKALEAEEAAEAPELQPLLPMP